MKTVFARLLLIALFSVFFISESHAALIEKDDSVFGTDTITLDTDAGLEWLDLSFTSNLSRNYVSTQFETGGEFEGFRYATNDEALALLEAAGVIGGTDVFAAVEYLGELVGVTSYQSDYPQIAAMTGSGSDVGADFYYSGGNPAYHTGVLGGYGAGFANSSVSSWLVRDAAAVPIPGALWLMGSGLVGLVGIRRKK